MWWFLLWVILSGITFFMLILEDKHGRRTPKWVNFITFILFFYIFLPIVIFESILEPLYEKYNTMRDKQDKKLKEENK